ncbi:MAG: TIGR02680 family protein [Micropruina sp.]|uniref:TIGR02680 family protein n=1 Tax=Micropruina sp. TaxID=2737536 RepID=UPI0039E6B20B
MTRWRPVRAGITNVWRYYDEIFTFDNGRLLLRGPNGSGKSKALEVLLPFLLDASTQPSRLSTFGTASRTMHWNLMGEGATGRTRVGFVWLELARDNDERVTIGARLQASENTTRVEPTYFVTDARVGDDLPLIDSYGAPLTVAALKEALDGNGRAFSRPAEYRTAVREGLFPGMTADRYNTLVQALLQLRRPKLSEHLDPEALSGLLSSALPPVDELQIAELAEGFERLDQQRNHLKQLDRQEAAARDLVAAVARYARAEIRRHATALTQATTALDNASATVRNGEEELTRQRQAAQVARDEAGEATARGEELAGAKDALQRSEAYQQGRNLDDLRHRVRDVRATADRTSDDAAVALQRAIDTQAQADADQDRAQTRNDALARHIEAVGTSAVDEGLVAPGDLELPAPPPPDMAREIENDTWPATLTGDLDGLDARGRSRLDQIAQLVGLLAEHEKAVEERRRCETQVDRADQRLDEARATHAQALQRLNDEVERHDTAVVAWLETARTLNIDRGAVEAALDALRDAVTGAGASDEALSLSELVQTAVGQVRQRTAQRTGELTVNRQGVQAERDATEAERVRLEAATTAEPPRSGWRDEPPSEGAPLWRLVDAAAGVDPTALAGLEAALQASGLLDAWVFPDGAVRLDGHDVVLGVAPPHQPEPRSVGTRLGTILRPDTADQPVPDQVVARLLAAIGLHQAGDDAGSDAGPWVGTDGRWRFGVQHGRWAKPAAQFIGAEARERHRRQRLAELTERLAALDDQLAAIDAEVAELRSLAKRAQDEARALPSEARLRAAAHSVSGAETTVQNREHDHAEAVAARTAAEAAVATRWREVEVAAAGSRLPVQHGDLTELRRRIDELLRRTSDLRRQIASYLDVVRALLRSTQRAEADADAAEQLRERADADQTEARRLEAELAELDATRGAEFREVLRRIQELDAELGTQLTIRRRAEDAFQIADRKATELAVRLETAEAAYRNAANERDAALEAFGWVMGTLLADDLDLDEPFDVDAERVRPTLDQARQVLRTVKAERTGLAELNSRMTEQVRQAEAVLADRAQLELNSDRDIIVASAIHGGRRTSVRRLLDAVALERVRTSDEITEHELALFRRILTGDTRRHLSSRIRDAGDLITSMNNRLALVRTSSEVRVRLVWEVRRDEGDSLARARELLLTTPDRLSEADEAALVQFLDERIKRAREADDGLPWAQQLAKVFDYTDWHRFRVQMARGESAEWKPLTKQVHSALSGGEKAIALHLPLFAALAAHYEATPGSPRLILLDEVFVGIDTANRGQIFGLLTDLDFDLLLTSDHEWAAYPQVDGIAIHALATDPDDDAVTSTRFVWTGTELLEDPMDEGMLL